jgi:ArsR family transcriptional regulator, virulence genes transcriptional regulator
MQVKTICSPPGNAGVVATDLKAMTAHAENAAMLLQALSNPHRLLILCVLAEGELHVSGLNARLELSQSALSQHLALLRKQGLVTTRRQAQTIFYAVAPGPAMAIVKLLHDHFCAAPDTPAPNDQ